MSEPFHPELNLPKDYLNEDFSVLSEEQNERIQYYKETIPQISRQELEEAFLEILEQLFTTGGRVSWLEGYANEGENFFSDQE